MCEGGGGCEGGCDCGDCSNCCDCCYYDNSDNSDNSNDNNKDCCCWAWIFNDDHSCNCMNNKNNGNVKNVKVKVNVIKLQPNLIKTTAI